MWHSGKMVAPYAMREIELTEPLRPLALREGEGGAHVLVRRKGRPLARLWVSRAEHGAELSVDELDRLIRGVAAEAAARHSLREALLGEPERQPTPSLTVAVCTRNRADLLRRCLAPLVALRDERRHLGPEIDILVVDNAPPDDSTRVAAAEFAGVRYVCEPVPGLNFGRNRALASTTREWLAFVDDDAVVDRFWLDRLAEGVAASPDAGGFTGPILPLMLETEAQLRFEYAGGFGKGFDWERFSRERWNDRIYPSNAGRFGTGACMVHSTSLLRELGGFDEALDTGAPLPGGGDIDMFYRVVRSGRPLVYLPGLLVFHEHRRDMPGLRKQYYSWGLSVAALMRKSIRCAPETRPSQHRFMRWWLRRHAIRLVKALAGRDVSPPRLVLAEILGGIIGYFGEYERSQKRIALRRQSVIGQGLPIASCERRVET